MFEVHRNLFIGEENDCLREQRGDWAVVHACKSPCHQRALGYKGSLPKSHPYYLVYEVENHVFLNMIDPEEPRVLAERLGVALWRVSKVSKELKEKRLIKVARNVPFVSSFKKANATYYLDSSKPTALHDVVMNLVWEWNIGFGGKSRDFSFECDGKTWFTDGLLINVDGNFILEVLAGDCNERVVEQLGAYSTQIGHMGVKGAIIVVLDSRCLGRIREEVTSRGVKLGEGWLLTTLRSKDEKLQFRNLLLLGKPVTNHRNPTSRKATA